MAKKDKRPPVSGKVIQSGRKLKSVVNSKGVTVHGCNFCIKGNEKVLKSCISCGH